MLNHLFIKVFDKFNLTLLSSVLFFVLIGLQIVLAIFGYWLTADEVEWHQLLLLDNNFSDVALNAAKFTGRVGQLLSHFGNWLSAAYGELLIFRVIISLSYYGCLALFAYWVGLLVSKKLTIHLAFLLILLHPLGYSHLPPNSYPLHFIFPVILILLSRVLLLANNDSSLIQRVMSLILLFLGTLFLEYGFLFACGVICSEFLLTYLSYNKKKDSDFLSLLLLSLMRYKLEIFVLLLSFSLILGWRYFYPPQYEGVQLNTFDISSTFYTWIGHCVSGTVLGLHSSTKTIFTFPSFVFFMFVVCASFAWLRVNQTDPISIHNLKKVVVLTVVIASSVSLPISLTPKYQSWCTSITSCAYLDSRFSYLATMTLLVMVLSFLLYKKPTIRNILFSIMIGFVFINNVHYAKNMYEYAQPRRIIDELATYETLPIVFKRLSLAKYVDPTNTVSMHPGFDRNSYWESLLAKKKTLIDNKNKQFPFKDIELEKSSNEEIVFSSLNRLSAFYLIAGFSKPERWGVWTDSAESELEIPCRDCERINSLRINASPFVSEKHRTQQVKIILNGCETSARVILMDSRRKKITLHLTSEEKNKLLIEKILKVKFILPDAISPSSLGISNDERLLGIGIRKVTFSS